MTAGLRQYLMLAGIGLVGGFALIVAILGPGELKKRATAVVSPAEAPKTLADMPGGAGPAPEGKQAPDKPAADSGKQAALPPVENAETLAAKEAAKPRGPVSEEAPSLDIVRVEPSGDAVIAGRAAPKAEVEILRDNKPIARAKADDNGQFAIVPPTLPAGNSEISYRSVAPDGKETRGKESVAIVVAENRATKPLVAVSTPDKPTVVLSQPETPTDASPEAKTAEAKKALSGNADEATQGKPQTKPQDKPQRLTALPEPKATSRADKGVPVKVVSIDAQDGGRLDVSGVAKPGATLRLYLNDTLVASGKTGPDGKLAFTIGRGVKPGGYQIRIDQVEPETGKVENRAQVAFAFPESAAPKAAAREPPSAMAAPPPLPGRPDADRKAVGNLAERPPAARDGNAASGASPPPAPAAEARASNRHAEAAKPVPPSSGADKRAAETAAPKPSNSGADKPTAQPERPLATAAPSEKPSAPEKNQPAAAAARPQPETPAPDADKRMAAAPTPKPFSAGPPRGPGSPAPDPSEPVGGMNVDTPNPGATAAVTPEPMPSDKPGTVFVPEISTARISRGDNLWQISRRTYGNGLSYTVIFDANKDQIRDPDLIYPGQIFVLPKDEGAKRG